MINYLKYLFFKIWLKIKGFFKKTKLDNIIFEYYIENVFKKKLEKIIKTNEEQIKNFILKIKKFNFIDKKEMDMNLTNLLTFKNVDRFCKFLIKQYNKNL